MGRISFSVLPWCPSHWKIWVHLLARLSRGSGRFYEMKSPFGDSPFFGERRSYLINTRHQRVSPREYNETGQTTILLRRGNVPNEVIGPSHSVSAISRVSFVFLRIARPSSETTYLSQCRSKYFITTHV